MRIVIVTPAATGSRTGNRITANRWAHLLRSLGHRVSVSTEYRTGGFDALLALHAMKSARSIARFRRACPHAVVVVALTGTDVYGDLGKSRAAMTSLDLADRIVVLQPLALTRLNRKHRRKATVIFQSVEPVAKANAANATPTPTTPTALVPAADPPTPFRRFDVSTFRRFPPTLTRHGRTFRVVVVGHLRPVKDPFRTAMAVRDLPDESRIEVLHFGAALSDAMRRRAIQEQRRNSRYRWMGDKPRSTVLRALGKGDLCALTSRSEGGANVLGEAIVMGTPVVSSRIAGSIGLLGARYPGYFPVGDTAALTSLLRRAETDAPFYDRLRDKCSSLIPLFDGNRERKALGDLFSNIG